MKKYLPLFLLIFSLSFANEDFLELQEPRKIIGAYNKSKKNLDCYTSFSYLYWTAKQKGLSLAHFSENNKTKVVDIDFNYKSGFKAGIGVKVSDDWKFFSRYTRLSLKEHGKKTTNANLLVAHWTNSQNLFTQTKGKWEIDFNIVDTDLSRSYFVGKKLILTPAIGIKLGFIEQKLDVSYISNQIITSKNHLNSFLLGPKISISSEFMLYKGLNIGGNISGSLFYQNAKTSMEERRTNYTIASIKKDFSSILPEIDMLFSIGYGSFLREEQFYLSFNIGYEFMNFFDQNKMGKIKDAFYNNIDGAQRDLFFHGLLTEIKFDF